MIITIIWRADQPSNLVTKSVNHSTNQSVGQPVDQCSRVSLEVTFGRGDLLSVSP